MKIIFIIIGLSLVSSLSFAKVPEKSATCIACHGAKGISANPIWPNLAGQKKEYLVKQLKDFKSGARKDALMSPQSKGLSDKEITELAEYYSSLK